MRTIEIKAYKFDELSDDAKETAIENFTYDMEYFGSDDVLNSIQQALKHFDSSLEDYSIDWLNANSSHFKISMNEDIAELSHIRLWKYIHNCGMLSYYCKYSKGLKNTLDGNCPFTGVCFDEDFLDEIREFMKKPDRRTFKDLLYNAVENVLQAAQKDYEEQFEENYLSDHFDANRFEFDENGNMI